MGVMAEIDMEKEQALIDAGAAYAEAIITYKLYIEAHQPANRTSAQAVEVSRLEELATFAKYKYDDAKAERYRL